MDRKTIEEEWRPVEGTNGKYDVSNFGRVRTNSQRPGLLTLTKQASGYLYAMVELANGKPKNCRVNRLVAQHFLPNPDYLPEVNHIDGNKENNHVSNLEWCTRSHNVKHSFDTGLKQPHHLTDEEREHLRAINTGKVLSEEHKAKLSAALKGRPRPDVSARQKGKAPSRKAIEASIATRKAKAEERKRLKASQPPKRRGRPPKHKPRGVI